MEKRTDSGKAAKRSYIREYKKRMYDQLKLELPKGRREEIKNNAQKRNMSVNKYISTAIDYYEGSQ